MKNEAQCKYFEDYDRKVRCKIDGSIHNDCCSSCPHFKPNLRLRIYWLLHPGERRLLLYGDRYYGTRKRKDIDLTGTGCAYEESRKPQAI